MCDLLVLGPVSPLSADQRLAPQREGCLSASHRSATRTNGPQCSQRLLVASSTLGGGGFGARPSCAGQRRLVTLRTGAHQMSFRHLPLEAGLFLRVPACLPGSSNGAESQSPRSPARLHLGSQLAVSSCSVLGIWTWGCPPVATLTAMRTRQAHILPLWARAGSGAHPAYHRRAERGKCQGPGHGKGQRAGP